MKKFLALCLTAALFASGCIKVDNSLGEGLVDKSLLFDTYTVDFPLTEITMKLSSDLSAYSDKRLTIGAIRDETFGLTTRDAAFTLIPASDTIDLGTNPVAQSFELFFEADSVSVAADNQERILQNIYVYELLDTLPSSGKPTDTEIGHGTKRITKGSPVYNGGGTLEIAFTTEFAQKYVDVLQEIGPALINRGETETTVNKYKDFIERLPGIYVETEVPEGNGGRINMFKFSSLSVVNGYYRRNNNIGVLKVKSTWDGVQKDSSFLFVPGETEFVDEVSYTNQNISFAQYCFNMCTHESLPQEPGSTLLVEGGGGLKPVISGLELQRKTREAITGMGGDPAKAAIVSASIILPFEMPDNYLDLNYFPTILSPTIRTTAVAKDTNEEFVTFAGLTDASVSSENQGRIDRSNLRYAPDITYHLQEILTPGDGNSTLTQESIEKGNADIWLLTIRTEKVANASGQTEEESAYYRNLMYASYYNSVYGGGYGNGGGYGGGYNNYYSYMMMAQMLAAQNQTTYTETAELDKDRYYKAILNGPLSTGENGGPRFRVTFAIPQK